MQTFEELKASIRRIIPNAQFDFDNYGQIVIYTELTTRPDSDVLVDFDPDAPA